jgi:hypothetical protein
VVDVVVALVERDLYAIGVRAIQHHRAYGQRRQGREHAAYPLRSARRTICLIRWTKGTVVLAPVEWADAAAYSVIYLAAEPFRRVADRSEIFYNGR